MQDGRRSVGSTVGGADGADRADDRRFMHVRLACNAVSRALVQRCSSFILLFNYNSYIDFLKLIILLPYMDLFNILIWPLFMQMYIV